MKKKQLVRLIWSSETDLWEAFGSGDLWIAYAWPNDWVQMKKKKLKVVYMRPKEKPIAWVGMFMLLKGTPRSRLAHAYVNAWSSATLREVAGGQLRLRAREHACASGVERPAEARCRLTNPQCRDGAERASRPRHPAAGALRQDVGRGEGLRMNGC